MLVFQRSHIAADLSIRNLKLTGKRVNGIVLKGAEVRGKFCWERTQPTPRTKLVLSHASVGRLVHDVVSWPEEGRLFLRGFTYEKISICPRTDDQARPRAADATRRVLERAPWGWRWGPRKAAKPSVIKRGYVDWVELQPSDSFDPHPYEQLGRVLRRNGDEDAFRSVGIIREERRLREPGLGRRERLAGWLLGLTLRHGYNPRPLVKASAAILIMGMLLFGLGSWNGLMSPTDPDVFLSKAYTDLGTIPSEYPAFNLVGYSVDTFLPPVIDFHQESRWLPDPHKGPWLIRSDLFTLRWGGLLRGYFWLHLAAGWVATSLLLVYLTGFIRER